MTVDTQKIAGNATLAVLGRLAMLAATFVGLPVAGVMMQRVITSNDAIVSKLDDNVVQTKLLQQKVEFGFDAAKSDINGIRLQLVDHEGRLRAIERLPARPSPN